LKFNSVPKETFVICQVPGNIFSMNLQHIEFIGKGFTFRSAL